MTRTVHDNVERFVATYNEPGSVVYPLYAPQVQWIEQPSGRRGGRDELFQALEQSRQMWSMTLKVRSIQNVGSLALVDTEWSATPLPGSEAPEIKASLLWALRFDENDLIDVEYDFAYIS